MASSTGLPTPMAKKSVAGTNRKYRCLCCDEQKASTNYYKSRYSYLWQKTYGYATICKDCVAKIYQEYKNTYKDEEKAIKCLCALLDWPFVASQYYNDLRDDGTLDFAAYYRHIQMKQYQERNFETCLADGELGKDAEAIRDWRQTKWTRKDTQNMNYAISVIGYDPFDADEITDEDRKYCFNMLAGYCDSEAIKDDGHKLQSAIQITQLHLQCRKIDKVINEELMLKMPNESKLRALSETKNKFLNAISTIVRDNGLATTANENARSGKHTLSMKMKEIADVGFEQIRTNLFDIQTAEAMKQVVDISNRSILEQLSLDDSDYVEMIKEQREMLQERIERCELLEEENRNLKNKISEIESYKLRKR